MKELKRILLMFIVVIMSTSLVGCSVLDKVQIKFGLINEDFDYLNSNNVEEISIQSTRDPGFKFIVRDNHAIQEMYGLLRKAEVTDKKTNLSPDYIFSINLGDEIKQFNYVVGAEDGNFYNDEKIYTVSNRLDEGIMQNLSILKKPKEFEDIYYGTLLEVLKLNETKFRSGDYKVGINIQADVDTVKYVFSTDMEKFLEEAKKITPNIDIIHTVSDDYDVIITLKNRGYSSSIYKTKISVNNKKDKIQEDYYIIAEYSFKEWDYEIGEPNKVPQGW